ncbi:MAG: uroporphyrinogen-III C-methyltransferase [Actinobacteria bacterium]|nr:MAG: uroporphyrinogen-III C-methyltransferase [Actinomycetota bacterium]
MTGMVYLVGAGPGDPRLLTLRGAEVLRHADVVVYDRLAPAALLDLAPATAERIDAGKAPGVGAGAQVRINAVLVSRARAGKTVVRLKGGDPFVFGRGGEEAVALARAGVPFEVVPGVTSAVAAPAAAGIPLTYRGVGSSIAVVTACLAGGEEADLGRVALSADTLVVLMAAGRLAEICRSLVRAGRSSDQPAAVIMWATTSLQRSVIGTLGSLPALAERAGIGSPATLVVGDVVALADELSGWEEARRPLQKSV